MGEFGLVALGWHLISDGYLWEWDEIVVVLALLKCLKSIEKFLGHFSTSPRVATAMVQSFEYGTCTVPQNLEKDAV